MDIEELAHLRSGADALELTRLGWDVFQKVRDLPFPTTALINGFCMGGGTELSLACRYRVALDDPKVRIALPEVMLGIMPAWHGVQWLPRLVGPGPALDMLLTGKALDAKRARRIGLVDQAVPLRILENTARMVTLEDRGRRQPPLLERLMLRLRPLVVAQARKQVARKRKREHYPAPYAILGSGKSTTAIRSPPQGPVLLDRVAREPPDRGQPDPHLLLQERLKASARRPISTQHVHIVGAGVMGGDIAALCAMRGMRVTLQDTAPERIGPAIKRAAELFKRRCACAARARRARPHHSRRDGRGRAPRRCADRSDLREPPGEAHALREAGGAGQGGARHQHFEPQARRHRHGAPGSDAPRGNSTSSTRCRSCKLVEIVSGEQTDTEVAKKAAAFVRQIDKLPLPVKDSPGFLVNRVLGPYMANAFRMLDAGAKPETLDRAMEDFGMPMGPAELADTVGLDICLAGKRSRRAQPTCRRRWRKGRRSASLQEDRARDLQVGGGQAAERRARSP